ncbi:MAG: queuosine precursor transporter [Treponema sp.]|nr:queuosine precursor transporter [Treponema sp.]
MEDTKAPSGGRYIDLVTGLFAAVIIISNIASSAKIVDLGFSIMGVHLAFDGGTLLFPLAYVIGALLTEVYGFAAARRVIWIGFLALAISALFLFILSVLPGEETWEDYAGSGAFEAILGGMSSGGIIIASLSAYLVGKFFDAVIHSRLKVLMKGRLLFVRALGSSVVGQLLDSLIFISIASLAGVFPWELFLTLVLTNCLLKVAIEALFTPLTYLSAWYLKKKEGLDTYDKGISYNPFKFS